MPVNATSVGACRAGPAGSVALILTLLLGLACVAPSAVASDRPSARTVSARTVSARDGGSVTWGGCADASLTQSGLQCATVLVPLDHAKPKGRTIPIAISRIPASATGANYLGPLVSNPGGPGVPGLSEPLYYRQALRPEVTTRFDLIGFDPRGTGESGADLSCDPGYFAAPAPDLVPPDPARVTGSERTRIDRAAAYVEACAKRNGAFLKHQRTIDSVRDLDLIRATLGSPRLSYIGNSYGTYLGELYATTFPTHTSRMVLSGVVPPDGSGYAGDVSRPLVARAYERNLDAFFAWVAQYRDAYGLGDDAAAVRAHYFADQDALRARPLPNVGPAEWNGLFAAAAYGEAVWPILAQGWSSRAAGRPGIFDVVLAPGDAKEADEFNASYLSVACSDGPWKSSYRQLRKDSFRTAKTAPFITWALHWELSVLCSQWPVTGRQVAVGTAAAPPMLMVNATFDAPTPFPDALVTRAAFPSSALVEVDGALGHAARSLFGNACAEAVTEHYLLTGQLPVRGTGPGPDLRCERVPAPGYPEIATAAAAEALLLLNPFTNTLGIDPPLGVALPAGLLASLHVPQHDPERLAAFLADLPRAVGAVQAP